MACRRELRCALVAIALLLAFGPAQALAAPQWLPAETRAEQSSGVAPDVATDADGNSVAIWLGTVDQVLTAYRPRGGPWGPPEDIEVDFAVASDPHVTALANGEFVAAWIAAADVGSPQVLRSATRSTAGDWTAETIREGCCEGIDAFDASGDGSVTVVGREDGGPFSNTRPPGSTAWGPRLRVPTASGSQYAFGLDGSVLTANDASCGDITVVPCVLATYLPPDGTAWGDPETVGGATSGSQITGVGVTATPGAGYTVVWGEADPGDGAPVPPGRVRSADREPGVAGSWLTPLTVADLPAAVPGCFGSGDCFDVAAGSDGAELAMWQQSGVGGAQMSASIRGSGGAWGPVEDAGDPRSGAARPLALITTTLVPVAAWSSNGNNLAVANGSHRDAVGTWHPVELGSSQDDSVDLADLATDGDGNALTAWRHRGGVFSAGFDGGGPRFTSLSIPAAGTVGVTLAFSAVADDNWSGVSAISWLFSDGGAATGSPVNHAYGAAGTFTASATATDGLGNTSQSNTSQSSGATAVTAAPTPTPDPCGTTDRDKDGIKDACDTNDGSKRPVAFKTVNATVVSGDVFVKLPGGAARAAAAKPPKGFVRLQGAETIPVGSTLDTAKGRVKLRSASDTRKHVQSGQFFRGRFVVRQVRKPRGKAKRKSTKLITVLTLSGSSFSKTCKASSKASASAKRRSKKRVRRLFGDGKGAFRTKGRNAAATVRGTRWSVQDRCDGTLVTVQRGRVSVRDLVKHRTVLVKTGHTYLARRR
jgi:hypothetical protein